MQRLCHCLKEDFDIGATFCLVGSGARNLILQNANEAVDLDYNLEIVRCDDFNGCKYLKESVKIAFNKCLKYYGLPDCDDSTIPLTSKKMQLKNSENHTSFSIDVCITKRKSNLYYRLVHKKTGWVSLDEYYWNIAPCSKQIKQKVDFIKDKGKWELVRKQYLDIKNKYLTKNETKFHPSFVCYAEAVNNVFNLIKQKGVV